MTIKPMTNPWPQPFPIHLMLGTCSMIGAISAAEWMSLSGESPLSKKDTKALQQKISEAARNKFYNFLQGINAYALADIPEWKPTAEKIWQEGSTRILSYAKKGKKILFITPLINRANILDLSGDKSLMKFLAKQGYQPLLVDWGNPGKEENEFASDEYVERLARFCAEQKGDLIIGGYCMGGMLALKLAKLVKPKSLILLATPWNFHAPDVKRVDMPEKLMDRFLESLEQIPPEFIQSLFLTADPWRVYDKFSTLDIKNVGRMEVEHWVNSGVPMTVPMAKECIIDWSINNTPGKGEWFDVSGLDMPVYLGCPTNDRIVPIQCSIPLVALLPNAQLEKFPVGHIGMLTKKLCFKPIAEWLKKHA